MFLIQLLLPTVKVLLKIGGKPSAQYFINIINQKNQFYYIDKIYDFDERKTVNRVVLFLPGKGCTWAKETGGCTMCGFSYKLDEINNNFSDKDLIILYEIAEMMTRDEKPFILAIYNAGSFINEKEISLNVQTKILQKVNNHPTIQKLFIESRPEFISTEKINFLKQNISRKKLIIGIGLEAQNDKIRNEYIHKGISKESYKRAIDILKKNEIYTLTYIFIKPIFLNELESIDEAIHTAEYAFKTGTSEVAFESAFVQKHTLMAKLYYEKKFTPPWLWSIIDVIKRTYKLGAIHVGGFDDQPKPIAIPSNCSLCSEKTYLLLQEYRETNNINLFDNLYCGCQKKWEELIKHEKSSQLTSDTIYYKMDSSK